MEDNIDKPPQEDLLGNVLREIDAISIPEDLTDPKEIESIIRSLVEIDRTAQRVVFEKEISQPLRNEDVDPRVTELKAKLLTIKEKISAAINIMWKKIETIDPTSPSDPNVTRQAIFEYLRTLEEIARCICDALPVFFLPTPPPEVTETPEPMPLSEPATPIPEPTVAEKLKRWFRNIF